VFDGSNLIEEVRPEDLGDETSADALDRVRASLTAREDR